MQNNNRKSLKNTFIAVNCRQLGKELLRKKGKQMG